MAAPQAEQLEQIDAGLEMAAAEVKAVARRARVAGIQIARSRARLEALLGTEEDDTARDAESDPEAS